jgi:carbon monoxide dehydrogenase subunit G
MASIRKEISIRARPDTVWAAIRDVGQAHRLFPGVLVDAKLDGDSRIVTFANGAVVRELIVAVDDEARRFAYSATGGRTTHHNASFQVFDDGEGSSRVVWITDVLPDDLAETVRALVDAGSQAMKKTLESATADVSP